MTIMQIQHIYIYTHAFAKRGCAPLSRAHADHGALFACRDSIRSTRTEALAPAAYALCPPGLWAADVAGSIDGSMDRRSHAAIAKTSEPRAQHRFG